MELIGRQTLFNFYLSLRKVYITFFQTEVSQTFSIHFCCSLQVNAYFWNQEVELSFKKKLVIKAAITSTKLEKKK